VRSARSRRAAFIAGFALYTSLLLMSIWLLSTLTGLSTPVRALLALLPVPAAVLIVLVSIDEFLASDELEQRVQLVGLAVAFLGTLLVTFSWGFLEGVGFERLTGFVTFAMLVAFYGAGRIAAQRRYQ
jgi:hypothetical protein